ncbi:tRNA dimethylallyltransferase [Saccharomycopsis crataegensis]|uniref:tRNA dimethylallyltransferase n=1 Tax=Saccharomycopsis crataegensis TaxID=43959 RepID=A0AAV5QHS3_9ASCO|nr:tRNA dimethylallyltransferase [Saccharomycopsis crataegensis]
MQKCLLSKVLMNIPNQNRNLSTYKPLVVIVGTTGVGKSQFSIDLATKYHGEIINADSMQMYCGAPLITNKHPINDRNGVPHHVMNHVPWEEEYFIHRFEKEALSKIDDIHRRGKIPIVVGGTSYYLQSLLFTNRVVREDTNKTKQEEMEEDNVLSQEYLTKEEALKGLTKEQQDILNDTPIKVHEALKAIDPVISHKFHPNDTRRVKRVLEIYFRTGKKPSEIYENQTTTSSSSSSITTAGSSQLRFPTLVYWLWADQSTLNQRLDTRVDSMFENGAVNEIHELYQSYQRLLTTPENRCQHGVFQVIGFKEFLPWLEDGATNDELFAQAIDKMKVKTRKYSKMQIKWIRNVLIKELQRNTSPEGLFSAELDLLDATDLSNWQENVAEEGFKKFERFLENDNRGLKIDIPTKIKEVLLPNDAGADETIKSKNWQSFTCQTCVDKDSKLPLILVGEDQWKKHLAGRKHRSNLNRGKKREEYEQWVKRQKLVSEEKSNDTESQQ